MTTQTETAAPSRTQDEHPRRPMVILAVEVVFLLALTVIAFLVRRGGLPTDGLWFDDAWVATGAIHGHLSTIMTVGSGHPLFTAFLMGWHHIDGALPALAYPALLAGTITPVVLYLALRDAGYERTISGLLAAVVAVGAVDILYSGRVKTYALDPVLVLVVGLVLHRLVARRWRWPTALLWTAFALVLGCFSGFVLLATAAAGVVLFLHPKGDRLLRGVAVAVQGIGQLLLFRWIEGSYNGDLVQSDIQRLYQAHLTFHANPLTFGREILTHLRNIAEVYPGGTTSGPWLTIAALAAIVGLVVAAFGRGGIGERIWARYLGLALVASFIGALDGKFAFGPTVGSFVTVGARYMVWVIAVMAFGLAAVLHRLYRLARALPGPNWIVDAIAGVAIVAVLLAGARDPQEYPWVGSQSASRYAESVLGPRDVLIVTEESIFTFAVATHYPVSLRATPDRMVGFSPRYPGRRIYSIGVDGQAPFDAYELQRLSRGAPHVVVLLTSGVYDTTLATYVDRAITAVGYHATWHHWRRQYVLVFTRRSGS
jgi:hypothetical protein